MASPLLENRLYTPRRRRGLGPRPRLSKRLPGGAESKVTLVPAPAGFGKTTLLADWLAAPLDVPRQNHGGYSVQLQGFFVLCSEAAIRSGACVPTWTSLAPGEEPLPLATTVNGQPLTSVEPIEAAAAAGLIALIDLGPGARIVGTISGN